MDLEATPGTRLAPPGRPRSRRLLVVDDDRRVCELLRYILGREGFEVDTVGDALAAIQHLNRERYPDAVICDVGMPGLDGVSLLRLLRQGRETVPFLLISGDASCSDRLAEMGDTRVGFLKKPFTPDQLLSAVGTLLA